MVSCIRHKQKGDLVSVSSKTVMLERAGFEGLWNTGMQGCIYHFSSSTFRIVRRQLVISTLGEFVTTVLETLNNTVFFKKITLIALCTTSVTTMRNLKICGTVFSGCGVKLGCSAPKSKAVAIVDRMKVASSNSIEQHPVLRSEIMWNLC